MTTGYNLFVPRSYVRWPAMRSALRPFAEIPGVAEQWKAFFARHNVSALIVVYGASPMATSQQKALEQKVLQELLPNLGIAPVDIGGVSLYRIPPDALVRYRNATSVQMEALEDEQRFAISLKAADEYLANAGTLESLSPASAAKRGLFPTEWISKQQAGSTYAAWLRGEPDGTVSVGVMGTYPALCPLIERYARFAKRISFPYPEALGENVEALGNVTDPNWLVMFFDRAGLARADATALVGRQKPTSLPSQ